MKAWIANLNAGLCRRWVQIAFILVVIFIGYRFADFVLTMEDGLIPEFERPPGVEAFLPISALVSLKYFFSTGVVNKIHPSGFVLFIIICLTALVAQKGFCAWVCPVGTVSEQLHRLYLRLFKKRFLIPKWADVPLRSLKYLLAGFFIWSVIFKMPVVAVEQFLVSPYHQFADVKMLYFFKDISKTALAACIVLTLLSFFIQHFWCRYLCPYGALLGIIGFLSVGGIKRNPESCTKCGKCEKICPGRIKIMAKTRVHSSECIACMDCVDQCPEKKALFFSFFGGRFPAGSAAIAAIFIALFSAGILTAKATGYWQNQIPKQAYLRFIIQTSLFPDGGNQITPEKMERMMRIMKQLRVQKMVD